MGECYANWLASGPDVVLTKGAWIATRGPYGAYLEGAGSSPMDYDAWLAAWTGCYLEFVVDQVAAGNKDFPNFIKFIRDSTIDPIRVLTGELYFTESDFFISAPGIPLVFERFYASEDGWRHSYGWEFKAVKDDASSSRSVHVLQDYDVWAELGDRLFTNAPAVLEDLDHLLVKTGDGRDYRFEQSETEPGVFWAEAIDWKVVFGLRIENGETNGYQFVLHQPGGLAYTFGGSQLDSIEDAWGNRVDLTYSSNSLLVAHSCGTSLLLEHGGNPRRPTMAYVSDDFYVDYLYSEKGNLTNAVRHVSGSTFEFIYQYDADGIMTNKTNPRGDEYRFTHDLASSGNSYSEDHTRTTTLEIGAGWMRHEVAAQWGYYNGTEYRHSDVTYDYGDGLEKKYRYETTNGMIQASYGPYTNITEKLATGMEYTYEGKNPTTETTFDTNTCSSFSIHRQYDGLNHVTALGVSYGSTNPVWQTHIGYDTEWNLPAAVTNAEGHWSQTTYTNGNPLAIKAFWSDTQSHDTTFGYYSNGLVASVTNPNLHTTQMQYDSSGNLSLAWAELGPQSATTFNALGHLERSETLTENGSSTGRITEYDVTAKGWVKSVTHPDESQTTFAHDNAGNVTNTVDRAGRKTDFAYAPTKKLTSVTRYLSEGGTNTPVRISYDFDKMFNALTITEPRGRYVETYQLDLQDRVTSVTNIENQAMEIEYFVGDFVKQVTRFDGSVVSNAYDQAGRLAIARISNSEQGTSNVEVDYSYYPDGELKRVDDASSFVTYEYDRLNRLVSTTGSVSSAYSVVNNYQHDSVGNLTNAIISSVGSVPLCEISYSYDSAERLTEISSHQGTEAQSFVHEYNTDNGRIASVSNTISGLTCSYEYDLMDRATNILYKTGSGSLIRGLEYEYDAASMIVEKRILNNEQGTPNSEVSYVYDSLDRLVHESKTSSVGHSLFDIHYSHDLAGNRTSKTSKGWKTIYTLGDGNRLASTTAQAATNTLFVSGSVNELIGTDERWGELWITNWTSGATAIPSVNGHSFFAELPAMAGQTNSLHVAIPDRAGNMGYATTDVYAPSAGAAPSTSSYSYNEAGCLTNLNGVSLEWDERYRLVNVDAASSRIAYAYDVLNRRISRTEILDGSTNVEYYVYNGNQVAADLDGSRNLLRTYVWGAGIDNLLSMTVYGGSSTNTYYAIKDHQNSVIALVDAAGSVVESYEYDAWGNTRVFNAAGTELTESAIGNPYTFQGREIDWSTGLYYFRARWYNPKDGRWLSKDPIGISGGLNLYEAFGNNPVNFVDPSGLVDMNLDSRTAYLPSGSISEYDLSELIDIDGQFTVSGHGPYAFTASQMGIELGDYNWDGKTPVTFLACNTASMAAQLSVLYPGISFTGFNGNIIMSYNSKTGEASWRMAEGTKMGVYRDGKRVGGCSE